MAGKLTSQTVLSLIKLTRYYRPNNSNGFSIWRSREYVQKQTLNRCVIFREQASLPLQALQPVCCLPTVILIVSCIPYHVRCSERVYAACKFKNRVAYYPFDDHSAPPLILIEAFCQDVVSLATIINNVWCNNNIIWRIYIYIYCIASELMVGICHCI